MVRMTIPVDSTSYDGVEIDFKVKFFSRSAVGVSEPEPFYPSFTLKWTHTANENDASIPNFGNAIV